MASNDFKMQISEENSQKEYIHNEQYNVDSNPNPESIDYGQNQKQSIGDIISQKNDDGGYLHGRFLSNPRVSNHQQMANEIEIRNLPKHLKQQMSMQNTSKPNEQMRSLVTTQPTSKHQPNNTSYGEGTFLAQGKHSDQFTLKDSYVTGTYDQASVVQFDDAETEMIQQQKAKMKGKKFKKSVSRQRPPFDNKPQYPKGDRYNSHQSQNLYQEKVDMINGQKSTTPAFPRKGSNVSGLSQSFSHEPQVQNKFVKMGQNNPYFHEMTVTTKDQIQAQSFDNGRFTNKEMENDKKYRNTVTVWDSPFKQSQSVMPKQALMSAENNRKSILMTKADSDTRHSMLLYGERYNKAKQNENADFRKIPVKSGTDSVKKLSTRSTYSSKFTKQTDKPYANLARAIKDSQETQHNIIDQESFSSNLQHCIIASQNNKLKNSKRDSVQTFIKPKDKLAFAGPPSFPQSIYYKNQNSMSQKQNQVRYKVLHHIWGKNRNYIKPKQKKEKIDTTLSLQHFAAYDPVKGQSQTEFNKSLKDIQFKVGNQRQNSLSETMKAKKKLITSLLPQIESYFLEEDITRNVADLDKAKELTIQAQLKQLDIKKNRVTNIVAKQRGSRSTSVMSNNQKFVSNRRKSVGQNDEKKTITAPQRSPVFLAKNDTPNQSIMVTPKSSAQVDRQSSRQSGIVSRTQQRRKTHVGPAIRFTSQKNNMQYQKTPNQPVTRKLDQKQVGGSESKHMTIETFLDNQLSERKDKIVFHDNDYEKKAIINQIETAQEMTKIADTFKQARLKIIKSQAVLTPRNKLADRPLMDTAGRRQDQFNPTKDQYDQGINLGHINHISQPTPEKQVNLDNRKPQNDDASNTFKTTIQQFTDKNQVAEHDVQNFSNFMQDMRNMYDVTLAMKINEWDGELGKDPNVTKPYGAAYAGNQLDMMSQTRKNKAAKLLNKKQKSAVLTNLPQNHLQNIMKLQDQINDEIDTLLKKEKQKTIQSFKDTLQEMKQKNSTYQIGKDELLNAKGVNHSVDKEFYVKNKMYHKNGNYDQEKGLGQLGGSMGKFVRSPSAQIAQATLEVMKADPRNQAFDLFDIKACDDGVSQTKQQYRSLSNKRHNQSVNLGQAKSTSGQIGRDMMRSATPNRPRTREVYEKLLDSNPGPHARTFFTGFWRSQEKVPFDKNDQRQVKRKEDGKINLHKTFLSQTQEYLQKEQGQKSDPIKLSNDLKEFNKLNKYYKWLEVHQKNIQMSFHEGNPIQGSPMKMNFAVDQQVKYQAEYSVSKGTLKSLKNDLITEQAINKAKIERQNFNFQGSKKQNEQLKRTDSSLKKRHDEMMFGQGSRERATAFHGVAYPNLRVDDSASSRLGRNQFGKNQVTSQRKIMQETTKSNRSFTSINGALYPRSLERNVSFTGKEDASFKQMNNLRQ